MKTGNYSFIYSASSKYIHTSYTKFRLNIKSRPKISIYICISLFVVLKKNLHMNLIKKGFFKFFSI